MYRTLTEKSRKFCQRSINTLADLQNIVHNLESNSNLRFRGVNEAKYTMLTSLQRNCPPLVNRNQKDYVSTLLQRVKNNQNVIAYFQNKSIAINDISCLALMQHQGLPTPLLDFSTDIKVSLAFAATDVNMGSVNEETDEYVSLYVFDKEFENEVGMPIQKVYKDGMEKAQQLLRGYGQGELNEQIDISILHNIDQFVGWNDIKDIELAYVEYQQIAPGVVTLDGQNLDLSNPNLDKQKGCFMINLYKEEMPLEENWNMRTEKERDFWASCATGVNTLPFCGVQTRKPLICYDIKKDVIKQWSDNNPIQLYDNSQENITIKKILTEIYVSFNADISKQNEQRQNS